MALPPKQQVAVNDSVFIEFTSPAFLTTPWLYNPIVAILDKDSKRVIPKDDNKEVNTLDISKIFGGQLQISFIRYIKITGNHVDEYAVVNDLTVSMDAAKELRKQLDTFLDDLL